MSDKYIVLGNGNRVGLAAYVAGIKAAKAQPDTTFKHGLGGWWPVTGQEIVREFYADMVTDHCNRGLGGYRVDRRSPTARLLRRIKEGKLFRECAWCGAAFKPLRVSQPCCGPSCERDYRG
jgi:hypothetical protein